MRKICPTCEARLKVRAYRTPDIQNHDRADLITEVELCALLQVTSRELRDLEIGRLGLFSRTAVIKWLEEHATVREPVKLGSTQPQTIYVVRCEASVKIGITVNLPERLKALQTGVSGTLELIASFPGTIASEKAAHRKWEHLRTTGEWFRAEPALLQWAKEQHAVAD